VGRGNVDVVEADGDVGDDPEPGTPGPDDGGVDAVGEEAHHRVDGADRVAQLVRRERPVVVARDDIVPGGNKWVDAAVGESTGDEDTGHVDAGQWVV
jgi:hypothetical protein